MISPKIKLGSDREISRPTFAGIVRTLPKPNHKSSENLLLRIDFPTVVAILWERR
jgi:hypothetical protein